MKRKNTARVVGVIAFILIYGGLMTVSPIIPEGTWVALIALMMAAWVADQIDPVKP